MKRRFGSILLLAALATSAGAMSGCSHRRPWSAAEAEANGVVVEPVDAYVRGGKLWVRVNVINQTRSMASVNRDAVRCVFPNGSVRGRASGKATIHNGYAIPPGGVHPVYVEFQGAWDGVREVRVDFSRAVTVDGVAVGAPAIVIQNLDSDG